MEGDSGVPVLSGMILACEHDSATKALALKGIGNGNLTNLDGFRRSERPNNGGGGNDLPLIQRDPMSLTMLQREFGSGEIQTEGKAKNLSAQLDSLPVKRGIELRFQYLH
jgi:hypothetical protein